MVKIKSLPFDATQLDIIQFFESFKLKPNGVQLVVRSDNRSTGEVRGKAELSTMVPEAARAPPASSKLVEPLSSAGLRRFRDP